MQRLSVVFTFAAAIFVAFLIVQGQSKFVVAAVAAALLLAMVLRRIPMMIAAVVCLQTIHSPVISNDYYITPFKVFFVALVVAGALAILRRGRLYFGARAFFYAMLAMLFIRTISEIVASAGHVGDMPQMLASGFMVFICVQFVGTIEDHRDLLRVYVVGLLISGLWVLVEVPPRLLMIGVNVRALGPGNQPNTTGSVCATLFLLTVPMILDKRLDKGWRIAAGMGILANAYVQFATASRGVLLATVAALMVLAWFLQRDANRRVAAIAAVVLSVAVFMAVAPAAFMYRVERTVQVADVGGGYEINDSARLVLATLAVEMIKESPLIGHGGRGFQQRAAMYFGGPSGAMAVHTAYLGVAVGHGLVCALIWTLVLFGAFFASAWLCMQSTGPPRLYYAGLTSMLGFKVVFALASVEGFDQLSWLHIGLAYHYLQQHLETPKNPVEQVPATQLLQPKSPARVLPLVR